MNEEEIKHPADNAMSSIVCEQLFYSDIVMNAKRELEDKKNLLMAKYHQFCHDCGLFEDIMAENTSDNKSILSTVIDINKMFDMLLYDIEGLFSSYMTFDK